MSDRLLHAAGVVADECISGSLDLFTTPYMETAIDNCYYSEHQPNNAITDSSNSISMNISGSEDLTDLSESVVQLRCKITKANGDNIDAFAAPAGEPLSGNSVGFIQMPLTSIFSSLVFRLNDQLLSDSFSTYPYLAYFQTILNFSRDARRSRLQLLGFYEDPNPNVTAAHAAASNCGFKKRASLTATSHEATFMGPVFHGLWSQTRYILPLVPMSLEWIKAPASFALKSNKVDADFKYKIISMKLFLKRIKIKSSYKLELEDRLAKENALYPLRHAYCRPFFIDANEKCASFENIFNARTVPAYCAVAVVSQTAYRGSYSESPFSFNHYSLTSLKISIDGNVYPSPMPFQPDYTSTTAPNWTREYLALQDNQIKIDGGNYITYEAFKNSGYAIYIFHFGRETSIANDHVSPKRSGSARLDVSFDSSSTNPALTILVYAESDEILGLTEKRVIERDYHL